MAILTLKREPRVHFKSKGRIVYDPPRPGMKRNTERWAIVSVDREITRYYRWWVQKTYFIELCQPSWDAHISIVRGERISPEYREMWRRLHGKEIEFEYGCVPKQVEGKPHFWYVTAEAPEIKQIRDELGLRSDFTYHLTIGRSYSEHEYVRPDQLKRRFA